MNKAILLHGAERDFHAIPMWLWLCGDTTLPEQKWFDEQAKLVIGCDFPLSNQLNPTACFGKAIYEHISLHKKYPLVPYNFKLGHHMKKTPAYRPVYGALRGGASIGAQAVQLAYWLKANRIILCGIDMKGDTYFDGTENKVKHMFMGCKVLKDGTSRHMPLFNGLCRWLIDAGVEVASLSETELDVPRI